MQAKLIEERTRRDRELNLKVRGLPPPTPTQDPLTVGNSFITDTLGIPNITLERAWVCYDSTLFIRFKTAFDRLRALRAKRVLFSRPDKIFLDEDLTKTQVGELKHSREQVKQVNGRLSGISGLLLETLLLLVGSPAKGLPNDGPSGRGVRPEAYLSVAGMGMVPFGLPLALC
ncbi:hypothetical protein KI387_029152 [Taxus chinensis]|uniref:Uncharacterized protein n=1 Tax=Taxus chinensis TaxID=29808 RepID=A0AA38CCI5_TAXCH|nr:hypothetical protein KI387_029152 [Taxus chinensis]